MQKTQSVETTGTIVTETFTSEEKILPKGSPKEQYNFATSLLKQGDYSTAERALREFVIENPEDKMAETLNIGMQKHLELGNYIQTQHQLI